MDMTVNNASRRSMTSGDCASLLRKIDAFADKFGFNGTEKLLAGEGVNALRTASETTAAAVASGSVDIDALESPTVNAADSAALNASLLEKLTSAPPARTSVMFNLYAIMELMQEVAQELRDAMRELRQAELEGIQANILAQAGAQETAAWWQLGIGLGFSGAQAFITGVGMFKQLQSNKQAHEAVADREMTLRCAKNEQKWLADIGDPEKIDTKLDEEYKKLGEGAGELDNAVRASRLAADAKRSMLYWNKSAQEALESKNWVDGKRTEIWNSYLQGGLAQNEQPPTGLVKYTPAQIDKNGLPAQTKELMLDCNRKIDGILERKNGGAEYWNQYKNLTGNANQLMSPEDIWCFTEDQMKRADYAVCQAFNEDAKNFGTSDERANVIRLRQMMLLREDNRPQALDMYKSDLAERLQRAQAAVDNAPQNLEAARTMMKSAICTQFGQLLGSIGQTWSQTASQLIGLEATRLQAIEKGMEERLDQNKDLFSDVMSLIEEVIRIYGEVTRAENQSLRDIMA